MASNELKKFSRRELLEMLLDLSRENDELRKKLEDAEAQLKRREIIINDSESLAEACLRLNGMFEAMRGATEDYNANINRNCEEIK
jgi:hypothetical protein